MKAGKKGNTINWQTVHERMARAEATLLQEIEPSAERQAAILRERAAKLAQPAAVETGPGETIEVIVFQLAHERYAIESRYVREVYPLKDLTPLPCVPAFVLGIVNLRGRIASVIDLKQLFDLPDVGITDLNKVILLHDGNMEFGVLADSIAGVSTLLLSHLQAPLPTLTGRRAEYLLGITAERLAVLNARKLIDDPELIVSEEENI